MKNPLSFFSKVFRSAMEAIPLTEVVTLEFCYNHVSEDDPSFNPGESTLQHPDVLQLLVIQENK